MTPTAIVLNGTDITWNGIIIAFAVAVCFCMTAALFTANGGKLNLFIYDEETDSYRI